MAWLLLEMNMRLMEHEDLICTVCQGCWEIRSQEKTEDNILSTEINGNNTGVV